MFIPAHPMHVQDGTTAIYVAAANGHLMAVKLLIAAKAQADIQNKVRFNCFFLVKTKRICIQHGWTALHRASQKGHSEIVRMLLKAKADVNIKTNVSHSVCWCAF